MQYVIRVAEGATESAEKFIVLFVFKGLSSSVECGWSFASSHVPRAPQALMRRLAKAARLCHKEAPVELCATGPRIWGCRGCGHRIPAGPCFSGTVLPELFFGHEIM